MTVGERIKQKRTELGWSRRRLADETGVPYQTLASLESGDQRSSTAIATIAASLNVDPLWLSGGRGSSNLANELAGFSPASLTPGERKLVAAFRELLTAEQKVVLRIVRGLASRSEP